MGWQTLGVVMILSPSLPPMYRAMFAIPNLAVLNSMACRVYRRIRFGLIQEVPMSTCHRSAGGISTLPGFLRKHQKPLSRGGTDGSQSMDTAYGKTMTPGIQVKQSVEYTCDPIMMDFTIPVKGPGSQESDV